MANRCATAKSSAAHWQALEDYDEATQSLNVSYVYGAHIDEVLSMRKDIDGAGT